jgi:hypothetical protein
MLIILIAFSSSWSRIVATLDMEIIRINNIKGYLLPIENQLLTFLNLIRVIKQCKAVNLTILFPN